MHPNCFRVPWVMLHDLFSLSLILPVSEKGTQFDMSAQRFGHYLSTQTLSELDIQKHISLQGFQQVQYYHLNL